MSMQVIIAKTLLDVKCWLKDNPDNFSSGWATKEKAPVESMNEAYYLRITAKASSIFIPSEISVRCSEFVKFSKHPSLFEWDDAAERKAAGAKPVTLAKRA